MIFTNPDVLVKVFFKDNSLIFTWWLFCKLELGKYSTKNTSLQFNNKQKTEIQFLTKFSFTVLSRPNPLPKLINERFPEKENKPKISNKFNTC